MIVYYLSRLENLELLLSAESIKPYDMEYRLKSTKFDISNEFVTLYKCLPKQMDNHFAIKINLEDKRNLIAIKDFIFISPKTIEINPKKIEYIMFENEMALKKYRGRMLITEHIKNAEEYAKKFIMQKNENNLNKDFNKIKLANYSNSLFKKEQVLNYEVDARLAYIYYVQLLKPFYLANKKLDVIVSEYKKIVNIETEIKNISNASPLVKKYLKKNSKELYKKICSKYKQDLTKNTYYTNKNSIKLNVESVDLKNYKHLNSIDKKLMRVIISNYNQNISIKDLLSNIGKDLKNSNFDIDIINDFRIIYNVTVNANFSKSIKNINNLILKCFFVAIFKKDNIVEFRDLCKINSIDKFVYPYLFLSYLKPYSEMSRSYKEHVDSNSLLKNLLFIEMDYLRSLKEDFYKNEFKKYIKELCNPNNIYKIRKEQIYNNNNIIKIKNINKNSFKLNIENIEIVVSEKGKTSHLKTDIYIEKRGFYKNILVKRKQFINGKEEFVNDMFLTKLIDIIKKFKKSV